jgi:hypothetical protein
MNDIKMMLGKRAAEYYLLLTWCFAAPILLLVNRYNIAIHFSFFCLGTYHYKISDSIKHYKKFCWIWISRIYFSTMDRYRRLVYFRFLPNSYTTRLFGELYTRI